MVMKSGNFAKEYGKWDYEAGIGLKKASLGDKAKAVCLVSSLMFMIPWWMIENVVKRPGIDLQRHISAHISRYMCKHTTLEQMRFVVPCIPLRKLLDGPLMFRQKRKYNNYNKMFPVEGASARWIYEVPGRTPDDPVVLYFHGGGYYLTTMRGQVRWMLDFADKMKHKRLSVLVLDYTVTPQARFPRQREQAVAAYKELHKSCNKIITLGDSAGGHLQFCLQDALHESSYPPPFGCVLVSPWIELQPRDYGSYKDHVNHDHLVLNLTAPLQLCSLEQLDDPHVNPNSGDAKFWLPRFKGTEVAAVWGQWELPADTIKEILIKIDCKDAFEEPKGLHDVVALGTPDDPSAKFIVQIVNRWLDEVHIPEKSKQ